MNFAVMFIGFIGLSLGSFVNALVWRLYQQDLPKKKRVASNKDLSISRGRSMCPNCKHTLGALDLVPVLSWLFLRGRCRYCRKSIGWQYPLVEISTAILFIASYTFWPESLSGTLSWLIFSLWLGILVGFMALLVYDIRWMLLPNRIVGPLVLLAFTVAVIRLSVSAEVLNDLMLLTGSLGVASGIFYALFQLSSGRWIGGGDVKLGIVLGLVLATPILSFLMLFIASIIGLIVALGMRLVTKSDSRIIPFGPSLIMATYICVLFGHQIIDWYTSVALTV